SSPRSAVNAVKPTRSMNKNVCVLSDKGHSHTDGDSDTDEYTNCPTGCAHAARPARALVRPLPNQDATAPTMAAEEFLSYARVRHHRRGHGPRARPGPDRRRAGGPRECGEIRGRQRAHPGSAALSRAREGGRTRRAALARPAPWLVRLAAG